MTISIERDVSLRAMNSFGVEARAAWFAHVHSENELRELLVDPRIVGLPRLVLGGGSNVLFTRDYEGLVLKIDIGGLEQAGETASNWLMRAGAGENWHRVVEALLAQGRPGLENLALIPGSVGASPIQNIGAYGLELAERFEELEAWDVEGAETVTMKLSACGFGYRDSVFKHEQAGRRIVLSVTFALPKEWQPRSGYADLAQQLEANGIAKPRPQDIFDAVVQVRQRKLPDPALIGNAGSFFKNPIVSRDQRQELITRHPSLVNYDIGGGRYKLAAGWLIEACGLKGAAQGAAAVHERHALVIVNRGGASGQDILVLSQQMRDRVMAKFGVRLEPEPLIV